MAFLRYPGAADADECLLEWDGHGALRRGPCLSKQDPLELFRTTLRRQNLPEMALLIEKMDEIGPRPALNWVATA